MARRGRLEKGAVSESETLFRKWQLRIPATPPLHKFAQDLGGQGGPDGQGVQIARPPVPGDRMGTISLRHLRPPAKRPKTARNSCLSLPERPMSNPKKVVLAYSGGLDTSIILKWLQAEYGCEVVTFTADLGQGEELEPARAKAELLGIKPENIFIEDVREEFVRDFVFPMFRANAVYEGLYLLGTSIARPLISKRLVEIAAEVGADAVAHGATGKGNDQVRFELAAYALNPDIRVIAPWREWDLTSRTRLLEYAEQHQVPVPRDKRGEAPFSVDANLLHTSSEGKVLEDPAQEAPEYVYQRTVSPENAPDTPEYIEVGFAKGDACSINGEAMSPATILTALNEYGGRHGVGRLDLVEGRYVGMKSRGIYETPGGTILLEAHRGIESITLDRGAAHLKDQLMPQYAELIYNGYWFSPEREMMQAAIDKSQEHVTGTVRVKLYKGMAQTVGRWSPFSLYSEQHVTFEDDAGAYDQKDAAGFIKINALRLRLLAMRDRRG
ncbi:MAG: argininosuccinate synthase [Paracoccaceae bacterium]|jgi:argininosuccinate synthase